MSNKEYAKQYSKRRYYRDIDDSRAKARQYNLNLKLSLFSLLGNKCVRCGLKDHRVLQIEHINGGGGIDKKKITRNYYLVVTERVVSGENKYQLLCANCNWIKRYENDETNNSF